MFMNIPFIGLIQGNGPGREEGRNIYRIVKAIKTRRRGKKNTRWLGEDIRYRRELGGVGIVVVGIVVVGIVVVGIVVVGIVVVGIVVVGIVVVGIVVVGIVVVGIVGIDVVVGSSGRMIIFIGIIDIGKFR
ncbi:hypothetical protein PIROE2DRAFT_11120 [Piromyces sp. E2]|nr:hypothetical protein PIROE2DRAFT_11120 [Piromyces sp. E2]|eukprot:OUM62542.1 hypothetical protein PIROE2DRAFT_11120 [Piromyces sp. E2]